MSDLPEDVVERVARAMFAAIEKHQGVQVIATLDDVGLYWLKHMARAALVASGYVQMREALEELANACFDEFCGDTTEDGDDREPDDSNVYAGERDGEGITFGKIRRARAALAAARGEGK